MKKAKILVVGSFVMDQIAVTEVFPRSGETAFGKSFSKAPGGKGANQAVQCARLGADVTMVGKLGDDTNGEEMLKVCREAGIDVSKVVVEPGQNSGCSMIILTEYPDAPTQNRILVIPGTNMRICPEEVSFLKEIIGQYDMVILQLEIPMEINTLVAKYAREMNIPVMMNPAPYAPMPGELLENITILSPNEHEAESMTGVHIRKENGNVNLEDVAQAIAAIKKTGVQKVIITLGSRGAAFSDENGMLYIDSVPGYPAVDPTAAGDSFIGSFCTGISSGMSAGEAMNFANCTATLTVSSMGAMPSLPKRDAVDAFLKDHSQEVKKVL